MMCKLCKKKKVNKELSDTLCPGCENESYEILMDHKKKWEEELRDDYEV